MVLIDALQMKSTCSSCLAREAAPTGLTSHVVTHSSVPPGTKALLVSTGIASARVGVCRSQSCHV